MEETGVLENRTFFNYVLPDFEPGPVSGYILINLSASACKASASVTW
jgi:hypothetical protein